MIAGVIRWSARNPLLILIAGGHRAGGLSRWSPVADAIGLSDTQVIVIPDTGRRRSPRPVTYPRPRLLVVWKPAVRGAIFGVSFIYVILEDGTDITGAQPGAKPHLPPPSCRRVSV